MPAEKPENTRSMKSNLTSTMCLTVALIAGVTSGCSVGTAAKPVMNPTPRQSVLLELTLERKPAQVELSRVHKRVIARYRSKVSECGVITYPAGSVEYPMYEVELTPDAQGDYRLWNDLIQKDRCNWKFTMLTVQLMERGDLAASASFTNPDIAAGHGSARCSWNAGINGDCGQFLSETNSDTTITLRVKEH